MGGSDDQVVVELIAQTAGFVSGMRDAAASTQEAASRINSGLGGVTDKISDLVTEAAKLAGITIGIEKLIELGHKSLETAENVDRMSQSLGFSVETVQLLGYTAALTGGGGLESMRGALARLDRAASEATSGNKTALAGFQALGIGGTQLAQLMKDPDAMLRSVVSRLSELDNGANKTNIAMTLMGRGAAEQIPMINKLGKEWDELKKHAQEIGVVLANDDVKALASAEDKLNDLGQQVHGLSNQAMLGLLPALNAISTAFGNLLQGGMYQTFFKELGTDIAQIVVIGGRVVTTIEGWKEAWDDYWDTAGAAPTKVLGDIVSGLQSDMDAWERMKGQAQKAWILIEEGGDLLWSALTTGFADFLTFMAQGFDKFSGLGFLSEKLGLPKFSDGVRELTSGMRNNQIAASEWVGKLNDVDKSVADGIAKNTAWAKSLRDSAAAQRTLNEETDKGGKKAPSIADPNAAATAQKIAADTARLNEIIAQLTGQVGGPSVAAFEQYEAMQIRVDEATQKLIADGGNAAEAEELHKQATQGITAALEEKFDALNRDNDIAGKYLDGLRDQIKVLGMTDTQSKAYLDTQKLVNQAIQKHVDLLGDDSGTIDEVTARIREQTPAFEANAQALLGQADAYKKTIEQAKEYVSTIEQGGLDAMKQFTDALTGAGDGFDKLGDKLVADAKQMVSQLLFQFFKLQVLGPFFSSLFGQASGFWGMFGGSGSGGAMGAIPAGIAMMAGSDSGGYNMGGPSGGGGGGIVGAGMQGYQMYQGYMSMMGGVGGSQTLMGSMFGTGDFDLGYGNMLSAGGGMGGALGTAGGIGGGYYLGQKYLGGTAGGIAGAAGIGAAAYFVPIIGWIAGAIALIDMMTGGGLLGTDATFNGGTNSLNVGAGGFNASTVLDMKGKKPLFGGSYHEAKPVATDPKVTAALQEWFDGLNKNLALIGKKYGVAAGEIIDASFTETFDKHGKVKTHTSSVGGETFDEDQQHFLERVSVLSTAGTLDKLGIDVTKYVNMFKEDADKMAQALQDAMQTISSIQGDLASGNLLLTGQKTLKDVWDYVQTMQMAGETLSQTYQRLEQAAQQYNQIMDTVNNGIFQMTQGGDPAAVFAATVANIDINTQKMVAQLNAAAQAAGLAGAKQSDLAKVYKYAALQASQAIAQLQSAGASLVDSLFGTGTLEGINSTISAIEGAYGSGQNALNGFGSAIESVAQQATNAMNLLLGTLSPYNDEQKLQFALQGFYKGSATKEQVLEIARNLYASGQQYKDLFEQLSHYPDHIQNAGASGGGTRAPRDLSGTHGLTSADLKDLYAQRDALQKQQRAMQAQQLAATVAQLSNAQGEDYAAIAKELNFKLSDLAKALGISLADLPKYLDNLKKNENEVPDTITSNTDRVVDILKKIFTAVGGNPDDLNDDNSGDTSANGDGHSGHARPGAGGRTAAHGHSGHGMPGTPGAPDGPVTEGTMQQMVTEQRRTNDFLRRLPAGGENDRGFRTPAQR